jgi:serine phosphatase RsbU (regulator of sigma subunit)/CHASE3 domain sensor protein
VLARLVAALAVVLAVLIAVAILGMVTTARDYREGSSRALARQSAANGLLINLLSAQSANRAYALTARGDDLRAYTTARDRYPLAMDRLMRALRGKPELEESARAVDRTAQLWFAEAVELIRLRRQGRVQDAIRRVNQGLGERFFAAFRTEHTRLRQEIEQERIDSLHSSDLRRRLTFLAIVAAGLLAVVMVVIVTRQVWRRVGGPLALLSEGVGRVTRGRLGDPVPQSKEAVRELYELVDGFNLMQREVQQERDAVEAAARREAAQATERHLWETVQDGLLPKRLPTTPGLRLAARYLPAEEALLVGGDFYDALVLPDGRLAVMVGDMAGHGAPAAAQAAGLRFGWRTMVATNPDPGAVMTALNAQMGSPEQRVEGLFASIIYMLIDPGGTLSFVAAGHPAPFLLDGERCRTLEPVESAPLLGVFDEPDWPVTRAQLPPGGTVVLYTDGLVEARQGADVFGVERACRVLIAERRAAVEARVERLVDAARRYEDQSLRDDVVVLAVERPAPVAWEEPPADGHPGGRISSDGRSDGAPAGTVPSPEPRSA